MLVSGSYLEKKNAVASYIENKQVRAQKLENLTYPTNTQSNFIVLLSVGHIQARKKLFSLYYNEDIFFCSVLDHTYDTRKNKVLNFPNIKGN